jgi:anti-sigma B factor antagonist
MADELLELTVSYSGGSLAVLAVAGDVDLHTSPRLRDAAAELVETGRHHLVLDLSGVEFFDSSGMSVLVGVWRVAQARGGSLKLAAVPDRLQRMLTLTGLAAYLPVHPSIAAALAAHHT